MMFRDRVEAGKKLANALLKYGKEQAIVLAIPRGGVILGYEVASLLNLPFDILIPRKIGAPKQKEMAIGAVTEDGTSIFNDRLIRSLKIDDEYIKKEIEIQIKEIKRRNGIYKKKNIFLNNKIIILIDDGVATGATLKAAILSLKKCDIKSLIIAVPVGPKDTIYELEKLVDEVICLSSPHPFFAVGEFYKDFNQITDREVIKLLAKIK